MFVDVVLPVLGILAAGWGFGRFTDTDLRPLSRLTFAVLSPALVFGYLVTAEVSAGELGRIVAYVLLYIVAATALTLAAAYLFGQRRFLSALLLTSVFSNSGNLALPMILLAYGRPGFAVGVSVLAVHLFVMFPIGIYFATLDGPKVAWWRGALAALRTPPVAAGVAALALRALGLGPPDPVLRAVRLVGDASVVVILLTLGMQVARTRVEGALAPVALGSALRLVVGPALAFALAFPLGLTGLTAKVVILQHAMPTAAVMTLLAVEYGARPDVVASATVVTTLVGAATAAAVLHFLEATF